MNSFPLKSVILYGVKETCVLLPLNGLTCIIVVVLLERAKIIVGLAILMAEVEQLFTLPNGPCPICTRDVIFERKVRDLTLIKGRG